MSLDVLQVSRYECLSLPDIGIANSIQKSRVGMSVNKMRQKYAGTEVASVAKKLIKSWKKLLPGK